jgi:hypothetical protein
MKVVIKGSLESSRPMIRIGYPSPKGRSEWRGQAVQVYNKFAEKLMKRKSTL